LTRIESVIRDRHEARDKATWTRGVVVRFRVLVDCHQYPLLRADSLSAVALTLTTCIFTSRKYMVTSGADETVEGLQKRAYVA
jgi:hypothetical protein